MVNQKILNPYSLMITVSCILCSLSWYGSETLNKDGIYYLEGAAIFKDSSFSHLLHFINWPFFSITVAGISQLLPFTDLQSAYLFNSLLYIGMGLIFLKLQLELTPLTKNSLWLSAFLFLSFGSLNETKSEILRDPAGWFCLMLSLWCYLKFCMKPTLKMLFIWYGVLLVGTLYRFELIVYIFMVPFTYALVHSYKQRKISLSKLHLPLLIPTAISVIFACGYMLLPKSVEHSLLTIRLNDLLHATSALKSNWKANASTLSLNVLPPQIDGYKNIFLFSGIMGVLILKFLQNFTWQNLLLASIFLKKAFPFFKNQVAADVWLAYAVPSLTLPVYAILRNLLLPSRIITFFSICLLWPLAYHIAQGLTRDKKHFGYPTAFFVITLISVASNFTHLKRDKHYLEQAATKIQTEQPNCLITDNNQISYQSNFKTSAPNFLWIGYGSNINHILQQKEGYNAFINQPQCKKTIVALKFRHHEEEIIIQKFTGLKPIARYANNKGKGYLLFRIQTV